MSLPTDLGNLRKQFHFTMFYTASVVFSFMNSTIYWFITRAHELGSGDAPEDPETTTNSIAQVRAPCMYRTCSMS